MLTNIRDNMLKVTLIYSCVVLIKLNHVNSVPLYPESNWRRTQTAQTGGWAKIFQPVELKPMSWDLNTAPPTQSHTTRARSDWDSLAADARRDARAMDLYHSTKNPALGSNFGAAAPGVDNWATVTPRNLYKPMELLPADLVLGVTTPPPPTTLVTQPTKAPTKAPEIDHWIPEFNIKLRPKSDHKIGPPNSTVFVHGEGFMQPVDRRDFTHPSFNILGFIQGLIREPLQNIKLRVVRDQPYFIFHVPDFHKPGLRFKRSHRVKRHHPSILQSVLGELQNYALVPIQSSNGKTSYILLKNPKFVIGASIMGANPTAAPQRPAVIQIARQKPVPVAPQSPTVIQIARQSPAPSQQRVMYNPGVILPEARPTYSPPEARPTYNPTEARSTYNPPEARPTYNPPQTAIRERTWPRQSSGGSTRQQQQPGFLSGQQQQQQQLVQSVDFQQSGQFNPPSGLYNAPAGRRQFRRPIPTQAPIRKPAYGRLGAPSNIMMSQNLLPPRMPMPMRPQVSGSTGTGGGHIQKTEVVETVVETQQAAVAKKDVAAANVATEQASSVGSSIGGVGGATGVAASNTAAAASQTASAATSSEVKKQKKVVTKKTTTTKIAGDGTGGAVKEVSQVVEHSVHDNAAVATADTAAASSAVSTGSGAVVMNVPPSGVANAASGSSSSAAASSSSAASASNSSVKSVKTIKKTTVTKTKVGDQTGAGPVILLPDPVPTAILSDKTNGPPQKAAKTAILSDNNPRQAAEKQAALIATESPRKVAARRQNRRKRPQRRRKPKNKKRTTTMATTTEAEMEMEEMMTSTTTDPYWATATPTGPYYGGYTPPTVAPYPTQANVAGWRSGPDPILGPNDRINTTDVPEEIEPLPDKTPAEKRAELRKLARERARKAGRKLKARGGANQPVVKQQQHVKGQAAKQTQSQNTLPRPRQFKTRNSRGPTTQGRWGPRPMTSRNQAVWRNVMVRDKHIAPDIPRSRRFDPSKPWESSWAGPTTSTTHFATEPTPATPRRPRRPARRRGRRPDRRRNRGRQRNRPPPRTTSSWYYWDQTTPPMDAYAI